MTKTLQPTPIAVALGRRDCQHGQRRRVVTESLLAEIFQGTLRAGQHLVIQELAARFEVSSTPIREALVALQGIGIVDLVPNRGAVVRRVTRVDVRETCQVRRVLECEATRSACGQIELSQLRELATALRRMKNARKRSTSWVDEARQLDSRLHDLISESCGNRFLAQEIGRLKLLFRAFRDAAWAYDQAHNDQLRCVEEAQEHLTIVEALLRSEPRDAARAMSAHIRSGLKYWSRGLPAE